MSHPTNSLLYDTLLDSVPREHLKKLQSQGLSEIEILNRYKAGELEETLEEHERGKYSKEEMEEYTDEYPIGGQVERFDVEREKELTQ